LPSALKKDAAK